MSQLGEGKQQAALSTNIIVLSPTQAYSFQAVYALYFGTPSIKAHEKFTHWCKVEMCSEVSDSDEDTGCSTQTADFLLHSIF
jgi:hypothetical protein